MRVAEPEQHRFAVAAAGVALLERDESARRAGEVAFAQLRHRLVVEALLVGVGLKLLAVDRHLLRLELAHAFLDALLRVLDVALQLGDVAQQLFLLPTQLGVVGAQQLELAVQVEQAALELSKLVGHLRVELGLARTLLLVALLELLPQVEDRAARLVIVEQPRLRGRSEQGARQCGGAQATGHASHGALQRLTSSARRFFAHASSSLP